MTLNSQQYCFLTTFCSNAVFSTPKSMALWKTAVNNSVLAVELLQSYTKPSKYDYKMHQSTIQLYPALFLLAARITTGNMYNVVHSSGWSNYHVTRKRPFRKTSCKQVSKMLDTAPCGARRLICLATRTQKIKLLYIAFTYMQIQT